jgi:hypothetical protein
MSSTLHTFISIHILYVLHIHAYIYQEFEHAINGGSNVGIEVA